MVEILPDDRAVVYWFTYDEVGEQQWFFGVGEVIDSTIVIDELKRGSGGQFGPGFDPNDVVLTTVGALQMTFTDCNSATAQYTVNDVSAEQSLVRLLGVAEYPCALVDEQTELLATFNTTASWYAPDRSGEGFIVQIYAEDQAFVIWFTYDSAGNPAWYTGIGFVAAQSIVIGELQLTRGGRFGPEHDAQAVERLDAGRLELFLNCNDGRVHYDMKADFGLSGGHDLARLSQIKGLQCTQSQFSDPAPEALVGFWESEGFGVAATVTSEDFTLFQVTEVSCLVFAEGPLPVLSLAIEGVGLDEAGNRLMLTGLDSVTPVFMDRVTALPAHCADGSQINTDPIFNYDTFASTFEELYAVFDERGVDWSQQRIAFQGEVSTTTTDDELFEVFSQMLAPLGDLHTTISTEGRYFSSGATPENQAYFQRAQSSETDAIIRSYMEGARFSASGGALNYGMLGDGVGYIEARSFGITAGGDDTRSRLQAYANEVDGILSFLADRDATRLVIDVRRNEGGNGAFGYELARRLLRSETRTIFSERRRLGEGLSPAYAVTIQPGTRPAFDGEIVLLTGQITGSAAENFTFAVRAFPHATVIGEATAGVLSRTERVLPNGWIASLTVGRIASPEGEFFEGHGIPPDITVPVFTEADYAAETDGALEAAISFFARK